MSFKFGKGSLEKLATVHPDLQKVAKRAIEISRIDFTITEGIRTHERQKQLFDEGRSQTLNSRHLPNEDGVSEALDFAPWIGGKLNWEEKNFRPIVQAFIQASIELGVQIQFGGLWQSFEDWPHVQLK